MPILSPIPDLKVPVVDITTLFFEQAQARVDAAIAAGGSMEDEPPLLVDGITGRSLRFTDIKQQSLAVAHALRERGLGSQPESQTVAVFSPVDISLCCIHYGTLMAAGVYTALAPELDTMELARRLAEVKATFVFVAAELLPTLLAAYKLADLSIDQANIILVSGSCPGYTTLSSICSICSEAGKSPVFEPYAITDVDEQKSKVAMIIYTSGTTGNSKGVVITHGNLVHMYTMAGGYSARTALDNISSSETKWPEPRRFLSALPLCFIYGHSVLCYQSLATGDCIVQLPTFDVATYLGAIERYKLDRLSGTPNILHNLLFRTTKVGKGVVSLVDMPTREFDIGSVTAVGCGGAALPNCRRQRYSEYFDGAPIVTGYGQTESSSTIAGGWWQKPAPGAVGVLYPNSMAKVIDAKGQETAEFGELCVAGPHVTRGYIGRQKSPVDADGFLHTGDYARIDAGGNVFLSCRMSDIIYSAQGPISPASIESVLFEQLSVEDCAVAGEGAQGQAYPVAYVVPALRTPGLLAELEAWLREKTGTSIVCHEVGAIPKSPAGKVLRHLLGHV
ncbi:hypothetical protein GGH94_005456 [Coemansia aciculifera]|uniref:Acetyl-CoA synthetase-like protein n=1 Tax=Coemansia aciculifera TaxID=417176 RepID=A0A9W8IG01_9FUNG|nr:hypothetical protein GGH94_005456 [Coemansia aciculifera]